MSAIIVRKLILTGGRKGYSGRIGKKWDAVKGVITLKGTVAWVESQAKYLGKVYKAFVKEQADASEVPQNGVGEQKHNVPGGSQSPDGSSSEVSPNDGKGATVAGSGSPGMVAEGSGRPGTGEDPIREALKQLDHENDDHWNADGRPKVSAVEAFLQRPTSKEAVIKAAPDFRRKEK